MFRPCFGIFFLSCLLAVVCASPRTNITRFAVATPRPTIFRHRFYKRQDDGESNSGGDNESNSPSNTENEDGGGADGYSSTTTLVVTQTAAGGGAGGGGGSQKTIIFIVAGVAGGLVLVGGIIYYLRRDKDAGDWFKHMDLPWGDKDEALPPSMQQQPPQAMQPSFAPPPAMPIMPMGDPFNGAAGPMQQNSMPPGPFPPDPFMNQPAPNPQPPLPAYNRPPPDYSYDSYDTRSQGSYDPTVHHDRAASEHTAVTWKGAPTEALTSISQRYNPDGTLKQRVLAPKIMIQGADEQSMRSLTSGRSLGSTRSGTSRRYSGFTLRSGLSGGTYKTARSLNSSRSGSSEAYKSSVSRPRDVKKANNFETASVGADTDYSWKSFKSGSKYAPSTSRSYKSAPMTPTSVRSGRSMNSKRTGPSGHYFEDDAGTDLSFDNSVITAKSMGSRVHGSAFSKASSSLRPHEQALVLSNSDFESQFKAPSTMPLIFTKQQKSAHSDAQSLSASDFSFKSGNTRMTGKSDATRNTSRSQRSLPPPGVVRSEAITGFSSSSNLKPLPLSGSDVGTSLFQPASTAMGLRNAANKAEVKNFMRGRLNKPLSEIIEEETSSGRRSRR